MRYFAHQRAAAIVIGILFVVGNYTGILVSVSTFRAGPRLIVDKPGNDAFFEYHSSAYCSLRVGATSACTDSFFLNYLLRLLLLLFFHR